VVAALRHPAASGVAHRHVGDAAQADPTGTADIRRRYRSEVSTRWNRLRAQLGQVVVTQDLLGIGSSRTGSLALAMAALPADGKIHAFQTWLDHALLTVVLETDTAYLDRMVEVAYARGVARAMRLSRSRERPPGMAGTVAALQQLVLVEMQGVCEAVSQALVRLAANASIDGTTQPNELLLVMSDRIDKIGVTRSQALVEFMVVKAHSTGTLDQFEAAKVQGVGVVPETVRALRTDSFSDAPRGTGPGSRLSRTRAPSASTVQRISRAQTKVEKLERVNIATAGDDKVCDICEGLEEDGPYTINQARSLIPAHPRCRCAFVPA